MRNACNPWYNCLQFHNVASSSNSNSKYKLTLNSHTLNIIIIFVILLLIIIFLIIIVLDDWVISLKVQRISKRSTTEAKV
jgi:hypothetical protein